MHARPLILAAALLIVIFFTQPCFAASDSEQTIEKITSIDLPEALADDDSFTDLPFEQLRQALREEVEHGPKKGLSPRSFKRYNLLIR